MQDDKPTINQAESWPKIPALPRGSSWSWSQALSSGVVHSLFLCIQIQNEKNILINISKEAHFVPLLKGGSSVPTLQRSAEIEIGYWCPTISHRSIVLPGTDCKNTTHSSRFHSARSNAYSGLATWHPTLGQYAGSSTKHQLVEGTQTI